MRLYNGLTRKTEDFQPLNPPYVGMYTCGPTVYDFVHIGNLRTYTMADILLRVLSFNGYKVKYIINITDVGHLTGDNLGDADIGEDRIEKAARKEGRSAYDVARFYEKEFKKDFKRLNLCNPQRFVRATEHIKEQIALLKKLEDKGFTYKASDGIYFDTGKFPDYGRLSPVDVAGIREGARVGKNPEKKNPTDFALWKFSYPGGRSFDASQDDVVKRRQMEWDSPWGVGFPGWHIECSSMSMKYLGESFDIHVGGEDLASIHHPNEIAQSEAATGKVFVRYWLHGAFMLVEGKRMSKSLGNNYRLSQLIDKGFEPLSLRYLYLQTHYRQKMNFTWEALRAAQEALHKLRIHIINFKSQLGKRSAISKEKLAKVDHFSNKFQAAIDDDLNMPEALSLVWQVIKSNIPVHDKYDLLIDFDEILGLQLAKREEEKIIIPREIKKLARQREVFRQKRKWLQADRLREEIAARGWLIEDTSQGPKLSPARSVNQPNSAWRQKKRRVDLSFWLGRNIDNRQKNS